MYIARMLCSDPECDVTLVLDAEDLMEIASALCDCGCTLEVHGLPDWVDVPSRAIAFPARRAAGHLGLAA